MGKRLREHIEVTYAAVPRDAQRKQSELTFQSASERETLTPVAYDDLDDELTIDMIAAAEDLDKDHIQSTELPRPLLSRGYLWNDAEAFRPTVAGVLLLALTPGTVLP